MLLKRFPVLLLFWLAPVVHADSGLPFPLFQADYGVYAYGLRLGDATRRLSQFFDGRFRLVAESNTTGPLAYIRDDRISEISVWRYDNGKVRPLEYLYDHQGSKKQRREEVRFDWDKRQLSGKQNGEAWQDGLSDNTLDPSVYQIALMHDLLNGKQGNIEYRIPYKGKLKPYPLEFLGTETVNTRFGKLQTVKFQHRGENKERVSTLWCASELYYLPVKLSHREPGGEVITMELEEVQGITPPGGK